MTSPLPDDVGDSGYDFVGVGFGLSNLAFAVAADEIVPNRRGLFVERNRSFQWHPGMALDGATMQTSFLTGLTTLRNQRVGTHFYNMLKPADAWSGSSTSTNFALVGLSIMTMNASSFRSIGGMPVDRDDDLVALPQARTS